MVIATTGERKPEREARDETDRYLPASDKYDECACGGGRMCTTCADLWFRRVFG